MKILLCLWFLVTLSYATSPYYRYDGYEENDREYPQRKYYEEFEEEKEDDQESLPLSVYEEQQKEHAYVKHTIIVFFTADTIYYIKLY